MPACNRLVSNHSAQPPMAHNNMARKPPMWMTRGDPKTKMGTLVTLKNNYENACDPEELRINMHQAVKEQVNEHGDIMLSQSFSTIHVESTIGRSEHSRKHCSDNHNMVTLHGHKAQPHRPPKARRQPASSARIVAKPTRPPGNTAEHACREERLRTHTGPVLKLEHYDNSVAQPLAVTDSRDARVTPTHTKWKQTQIGLFTPDDNLFPTLPHQGAHLGTAPGVPRSIVDNAKGNTPPPAGGHWHNTGNAQARAGSVIIQGTSDASSLAAGSGATATDHAQLTAGADIAHQTSNAPPPAGGSAVSSTDDATPLVGGSAGLPLERLTLPSDDLLDQLINAAESDTHSEAANIMLEHLHGFPLTIHSKTRVQAVMTSLLTFRDTIMPRLAVKASRRPDSQWTPQEWERSLRSSTLTHKEMSVAVEIWKQEIFPLEGNMSDNTRGRLQNARSNEERRNICRSAFRAWQKERYGHAGLAKVFLKRPHTDLSDPPNARQEYIESPDYKEQRSKHAHRNQEPAPQAPADQDTSSSQQETTYVPPASRTTRHHTRHHEHHQRPRAHHRSSIPTEAEGHPSGNNCRN